MHQTTRLAFLVSGLSILSCSANGPDLSTPSGTYLAWREAEDRGDYRAIFQLMVSPVREQIRKTYENLQEAQQLVRRHYPVALQRQALEDLAPREMREAPDPASLYAAMVLHKNGKALDLVASSTTRRWLAEVRTIVENPPGTGRYELVPMSGAKVELVREEDGQVHMVPSDSDLVQIRAHHVRSLDRLASIRQGAEVLRGDAQASQRR